MPSNGCTRFGEHAHAGQGRPGQTDGLNGTENVPFPRIEEVSIFSGDVRKVCAYRKWRFITFNFLKVLTEVNIMCQNQLFFDIIEGRKMAGVSMAEKSWPC